MKKNAFIAVFSAVLLFFSACAARQIHHFYPNRDFRADFTLTKGDFCCGGNVACKAYDDLVIAFTYPEGLSFFNVRVSSDGLSAEVDDTTDAQLLEELPEDAPIKLMVAAIRSFVFTNVGFRKNERGEYACAAELAAATVRGSFSPDGVLLSIDCEENGLHIEFEY